MVAAPDLPAEVLTLIFNLVSNRDIKNLRLTNKFFHATAKLRLSRVFLSANPLNIEVFRSIADDDTFRYNIIEIIWDDARLKDVSLDHDAGEDDGYDGESPALEDDDDDTGNESQSDHGYEPRGIPRWFAQACRRNIEELRRCDRDVSSSSKNERATQLIFQLPFQKSWKRYWALLRQQREVLNSDADAEAFRYGLQQFPSLKRVVVTPAAHGRLFQPLYQTPMIRAFKYGFNYPIPRGWPTAFEGTHKPALPWAPTRHRWRGVCIILRELARDAHHHVTDFLVDAHRLPTGLNSCMFNHPNPEYNDLLALLRRPGFARIHLDLLIGGQETDGWPIFHRGLLRDALGEATALKHVSVGTDSQDWGSGIYEGEGQPPSLRCLFPVDKWPELEHLGLRNFKIEQEDLVAILTDVSTTLRSLELSNLAFPSPNDERSSSPPQDWSTLLCAMRDKLGWQSRSVRARPKVSIGAATDSLNHVRHAWVDKQAMDDFLYNGGGNPFFRGAADRPGRRANVYNLMGRGATETDPLDESYAKPWDE